MFQSEHLQEKWAPLLNYEGLDSIKDSHRRAVTAVLLENQERFLREQSSFETSGSFLTEASPTNSAGNGGFTGGSAAAGPTAGFDPVLISLIRRSMPNLIAYDIAGVQPMSGPTGLIQPAGLDDAAGFTDANAGMGTTAQGGVNPSVLNPVGTASSTAYNVGQGLRTDSAENLHGTGD
jgi:hypothetical protein